MYINHKLNIVVPMAGAGSRFEKEGFLLPKPLIDINGSPMIEWVVDNLKIDANYIFIVQQSHIDKFAVDQVLKRIKPECTIFPINGVTDGAARSVLLTKNLIDNNNPLLIVNSDNIIEWDSKAVMEFMSNYDGGITTIQAAGPKWSYASTNELGYVTKIAEKVQISTNATTGHYYWRTGSLFVQAAQQMIDKDIRYNNEFYVAPVYNQLVEAGSKVVIKEVEKFWSVGTPEDLAYFHTHCDKTKVR